MKKLYQIFAGAVLLFSFNLEAQVYVNHAASGSNDGSSWTNAFQDLQPALDAATAGQELWVASGVYMPTESPDGTITDTRDKSFHFDKNLKIYGGFTGTETVLSDRDWKINATILSGDINVSGDVSDNCYHVMITAEVGASSTIDGFIIKHGNADDQFGDLSYAGRIYKKNRGGGMNNQKSLLSVRNVVFLENSTAARGGGIFNDTSSIMVENVVFTSNNSDVDGGGMSNYRSSPTIVNSSFDHNVATSSGGAILFLFSTPSLVNTTFFSNTATNLGGGAIWNYYTTSTITNCIFWNNKKGANNNVPHAGIGNNFGSGFATVTYSLTQQNSLYPSGPGIINYQDPLFVDTADMDGPDNIWMNADDGLVLQGSSPVLGQGTASGAPLLDITGVTRYTPPSMGAYFGQANFLIKLKAYYDRNKNNIFDSGESLFSLGSTKLTLGIPANRIVQTSSNSIYRFNDSARVDFTYIPYRPYYNITLSKPFTTFQNGREDSLEVALDPLPNIKDLTVQITPKFGRTGVVRPGFMTEYIIHVLNLGGDAIPNPVLKFSLDPRQQYNSSSHAPTSVVSNHVEWQLPPMLPLGSFDILLEVQNEVVPLLNGGDITNNTAIICPIIGDQDSTDNIFNLQQTVKNAYDPNDKNESHNGKISTQQATDQEWLYYLIRCQNTGNDTAFTVVIRDTLDDNVDGSTLQVLNSSHDNQMQILSDKYVTWTFNEIDLVDSNTSEPLSHGYIQYRIKPEAGLVLNDEIDNSASIYFDYNPPVITNTHNTIVSDDLNCTTCVNHALHFDGTDDYVQATSPLTGNSDYTIEAWFYSENTGGLTAYNRIIGWQNFQMELGDAAGELRFYDGTAWNSTGVNIRDAQWHHVAVTREGMNYKVYVDGNIELNYQRNNTVNLSGFFRLGSKYNLFNEMWHGRIDDVRMWNHARSGDKIMAKHHCSISDAADDLVLQYSFDQGVAAGNNVSETSLIDMTENAQHGTLNSFALNGTSSNWILGDARDENLCLDGTIDILRDGVLVYEEMRLAYQTPSAYTTIEINFGDGSIANLPAAGGFASHEYDIPGVYDVSLLLDGKCVTTQQVLIESCQWQAYTQDFNSGSFDQYHGSCAFILPGPKTAYLHPSNTTLTNYKTNFINYQPYGVTANEVIYDVFSQNTSVNGGLVPNETELVLAGRKGEVAVTFANDLASTKFHAPGVSGNNIAGLDINTTVWHELAIKITNEVDVDVLVDNTIVHSFTMSQSLGELIGLELNYHGSGTVEIINLSKSPTTAGEYLIENFVSCEQACRCVYNRYIDNPELAYEARTYGVANYILADNLIPANANIVYNAGREIELQAEFQASLGSEFEAKLEGCTMYCNSINPLFDLEFLQPFVGNSLYRITHCQWNGQNVFQVSYCNSSNGTDTYFYDCTGYLICTATAPGDACFSMFSFTNCEVLQGC